MNNINVFLIQERLYFSVSLLSWAVVAAHSGCDQNHGVCRWSHAPLHHPGCQPAHRVRHTRGATPTRETQRHEQSLLEVRASWSWMVQRRVQVSEESSGSVAGRWWSALMRLQMTRSAGWWCSLDLESSSLQVGLAGFHCSDLRSFMFCCVDDRPGPDGHGERHAPPRRRRHRQSLLER